MQLIKKWDLTSVTNANFTANHGAYWNEKIRLDYDPNPNVSYLVTVHKSSNCPPSGYSPGAYVESIIEYFDDTNVNKNYSKGAGIRISKIINYNADNSIVNSKLYNYQGGKLLFKFEPLSCRNSASYNCYNPEQGCLNGVLFIGFPLIQMNLDAMRIILLDMIKLKKLSITAPQLMVKLSITFTTL